MEIKLRRNGGAPAAGAASAEEKTERLTKREETIIARAITRRGHANYEAPADAIAPGFYGPAATLRNRASKASVILRLISASFPSRPPGSLRRIHLVSTFSNRLVVTWLVYCPLNFKKLEIPVSFLLQ